VRSDDDEAIFERLYPGLFRYAGVLTAGTGDDPDDLVQEALTRALRRAGRLSRLDNPRAYLNRAMLNATIGRHRRRAVFDRASRRLVIEDSAADDYPSDLAVLSVLSPLDRTIVYRHVVEQVPHRELAEDLDLSEGAVRNRFMRARRQLLDESQQQDREEARDA
jgi:RNA polymerase sigma factor (sigma-70 family)